MAKRTAQTLAKRQREMARKEKQQKKSAKRQERKELRAAGLPWGGGAEGEPTPEERGFAGSEEAEGTGADSGN